MNKLIHGLIAAVFSLACWWLWAMLTMVMQTMQRFLAGAQVPPFTRLCLDLRSLLVLFPLIAGGYCLHVWVRRSPAPKSWVGFFATSMGALVLLALPTMIAAWLPLIRIIEKVAK